MIRSGIFICFIFLVLSNFSNAFSQSNENQETLLVNGEIAFWPFDKATLLSDFAEADVSETGEFSVIVSKPERRDLIRIRRYIDLDCLSTSNADSRYAPFSYFSVLVDEDEVAELYFQTPRFDFQLGDAYKEWHYYSESTTVSGRCVDKLDDDFEVIYEFPNIDVKAGWNELTGTIVDVSDNSETYVFSLENMGHDFVWEVETLDVDSYFGIGATIGYTDDVDGGLLVNKVELNGPAAAAGLQIDDVITEIGEASTLGMPVAMAVLRLRGLEGTPVSFDVLREGEVFEFEVTRMLIDN